MQGHGRRFRKLAEERLTNAHVLAPDLRGHGRSGWAPPWNLATHVADVLETFRSLELRRATWIGYSFGGRILLELLARAPALVERAVLLDPAVALDAERAAQEAEAERRDLAFASRDEAFAARQADAERAPAEALEEELDEHLVQHPDGLLRFRYLQSAVVAAYGEIAAPPPPPAAPVPTLLVVAEDSWLVREGDVAWLRDAFGAAFETRRVPGGHIVLWDAYEETAEAVAGFLRGSQ